jgi:hypothetical protein
MVPICPGTDGAARVDVIVLETPGVLNEVSVVNS